MISITRRQREILDVIDTLSRKNGYPPSTRAIGQMAGGNPSTIHMHVDTLVRKGMLSRIPKHPRTVIVTELGRNNLRPLEDLKEFIVTLQVRVLGLDHDDAIAAARSNRGEIVDSEAELVSHA